MWVRLACTRAHAMSMRFQFTHPCGCDFLIRQFSKCVQEFQFTHPCGCDVLLTARSTLRMKFQFTHPCGCDTKTFNHKPTIESFNSRTRVGATPFHRRDCHPSQVSIHAPVWVRPGEPGIIPPPLVSIHAPVWVRLNLSHPMPYKKPFQFTHPCGCDVRTMHGQTLATGFNSRTRVGATA